MTRTWDLTKGKPLKTIFLFMLPILIGNVFQQIYSMADAVIVGNTLSDLALGGVGATGSVSFLVINFAFGLTAGFSVYTAQRFGANDTAAVRKSAAQGVLLAIFFTIVLTAVALVSARPLLTLMKTSAEIFPYAYGYITVIYAGVGTSVFYNLFSNMLRAIGDSKTPLYFLIMASLINVGLDLLFIMQFHMGVAGAGLATILAQGLSAIACAVYTFHKYPVFKFKLSDLRPDFAVLKKELYLGLPMAFQFSLISIGLLFVQVTLNMLGDIYVIAFTAASKIDVIACQFMLSTGAALAVYVGQNYGAKNYPRIKAGVRAGIILSVVGSVIFGVLVIVLAKPLTMLFVGGGKDEIYSIARTYLLFNGMFYFVLGLLGIYRNALQGVSRSLLVLMAGLTELIVRTTLALLAMRYWGYTGVCLSASMTWVATTIYLIIAYYTVHGKVKREISGEDSAVLLEEPACAVM
jgi:putative MATE family efflux protein